MYSSALKKMAIGLVAVIALSACAPVFEDPKAPEPDANKPVDGQNEASKEQIEIGVLLPLSGGAASYGLPAQRVLQIAAEEINAEGGIKGQKVRLVFEDGGCESQTASSAVNSLINLKKVKVIIGGFCSSETLAAAQVANDKKVLVISPAASSPEITTKGGDYVFRNYPSDAAQGQLLAEYVDKKGMKKIGMLVEEQPYTEGIADAFKSAFSGEVVIEKFPTDAADFLSLIDKLKAAQVDTYFVDVQAPDKGAIMIKQLKEAGIKGPLILNDVPLDAKEITEPFKEYLEGTVGALVPYNETHPKFATLVSKYKEKNGEDIPYLSYMAPTYDSLYIIKEAIEAVGFDGEKMKNHLYTVSGRVGVAGTLSFDENGDPDKSYRHTLRKLENGKAVLLTE